MSGITDPAQPFFKDGQWGWDGSQWRRQPLLFGFSEVAGENVSDADLATGNNSLTTTVISAGSIVVVRHVAIRYDGTPPTYLTVQSSGVSGTPPVINELNVVSNQWYMAPCFIVLEADYCMLFYVSGATLHDSLLGRYSGYKMSIVE